MAFHLHNILEERKDLDGKWPISTRHSTWLWSLVTFYPISSYKSLGKDAANPADMALGLWSMINIFIHCFHVWSIKVLAYISSWLEHILEFDFCWLLDQLSMVVKYHPTWAIPSLKHTNTVHLHYNFLGATYSNMSFLSLQRRLQAKHCRATVCSLCAYLHSYLH